MSEDVRYGDWQAREQVTCDTLTAAPLRRLAALLDDDRAPWPAGELPPLAHWLYFLPDDPQATLGPDGHPTRGGLLPPVAAPRRMWAGSRIRWLGTLPVDAAATRRSIVTRVVEKTGRSGALMFVTVRHSVSVGGVDALVEEQDLVFRDPDSASGATPSRDDRASDATRALTTDVTALFRFSALTFNAHRIHYDRDYARAVEGYPGLVVHGPFQAMLLIDHLLRHRPGVSLAEFAFRGVRPLIGERPFTLHLAETAEGVALWTRDAEGFACMEATAWLR